MIESKGRVCLNQAAFIAFAAVGCWSCVPEQYDPRLVGDWVPNEGFIADTVRLKGSGTGLYWRHGEEILSGPPIRWRTENVKKLVWTGVDEEGGHNGQWNTSPYKVSSDGQVLTFENGFINNNVRTYTKQPR